MKRFISLLLSLVICFLMLPQIALEANAIAADGGTIVNPTGASGKSFSSAYAAKLDNIFQGTVSLFSKPSVTFPLGSSLNINQDYYVAGQIYGRQCYIYAQAVYYYLFGDIPYHGDGLSSGKYWSDSTKVMANQTSFSYDLFVSSGVGFGAYIRTTKNSDGSYSGSGGHSMIVLSYNQSGITYLDCNADGKGLIQIQTRSWTNFNEEEIVRKGRRISHIVQCNSAVCSHKYEDCGVCSECGFVYDWKSTFTTTTMGKYKVLESGTPRTDAPYSAATSAGFCMNPGSTLNVLGSYTNAYGNKWYIYESGGEKYYIFHEYLEFVSYCDLEVTCTNFSPANNSSLEQKAQPVTGTVTSNYPLKSIEAYLDGTKIATWTASNQTTTSMQLKSSPIDNSMKFAEMSIGKHTIVLKAWDYIHSSAVEFHRSVFYIRNAACTHSYSSTVTKAATCTTAGVRTYTCSACGDSYTETIPATGNHSYGSWVTVTAATCTANGTKKKTCSTCGHVQKQEISAIGHNYQSEVIGATCSDYEKIRYTCTNCQDSYEKYTADVYSQWSATKPAGVPDSLIQIKTQYRYADYEKKFAYDSSLSGYELLGSSWDKKYSDRVQYVKSWPSGFDTSHAMYKQFNQTPVADSETATEKTRIDGESICGYLYYHWCRGTYTNGPIDRRISEVKTSTFSSFHGFYSTVDPSTLNADTDSSYVFSNGDCCKDSHWYFCVPVYWQTYSVYQKLYTYGKWGEWSDWTDAVYSASAERKVETRMMYRYLNQELGDHRWSSGEVTTAATCTQNGVMSYTCSVCGDVQTQTISATGHSYVETDKIGATCTEFEKTRYACLKCQSTYEEYTGSTYAAHNYQDGYCIHCEAADPDYMIPAAILQIESKTVAKGTEFTVSVVIKDNPGFSYLEMTPVYDSALTLVNVENGDLISDFTAGKQYVWVSDEDTTANGVLLTYTFAVSEDAQPGNYQVSFQVRTCANNDEQVVAIKVEPGKVEVTDILYGDATGDGKIDGFDVIRLKKYLANYDYDTESSTVEINMGADATGDGKIDGFDVIRLKKYLANYDYETGDSTIELGPQ